MINPNGKRLDFYSPTTTVKGKKPTKRKLKMKVKQNKQSPFFPQPLLQFKPRVGIDKIQRRISTHGVNSVYGDPSKQSIPIELKVRIIQTVAGNDPADPMPQARQRFPPPRQQRGRAVPPPPDDGNNNPPDNNDV